MAAVAKFVDYLGSRINLVLLAGLCVVGGIVSFLLILELVNRGSIQRFDNWAILRLRVENNPSEPIGPPWLQEIGRDITALGGVAVLSLITLAVVGYLLLTRKYNASLFVLGATVGGLVLSTILKLLIHRDRPELVPYLSIVDSPSFPSGHSMLSATVYLTLGALLARFTENRVIKLYYVLVAMTLSFLVGVSRVYMGVHYPTDVLAGWSAGLVWALLCWLGARYLQRHGHVETQGS